MDSGYFGSGLGNSFSRASMRIATLFLCLVISMTLLTNAAPPLIAGKYAIAIHGGAGIEPAKLTAEERAAYEKALSDCLSVGEKILAAGGTALDAVEQTIRALEDEPLFNAGRGAVFNSAGKHELDASIMDGSTRACGAVASVSTVRNPISLARIVMTDTKQVLLIAEGAEKLADRYPQIERVSNDWFSTPERRKEWEEKQTKEKAKQENRDSGPASKGTVGCVALDKAGHLAAGTSTGGMTNKPLGRVGDSPIIGAGTYAEDGVCAVSCTGTGEEFIRASAAFHLAALNPLQETAARRRGRGVVDQDFAHRCGRDHLSRCGGQHRSAPQYQWHVAGVD